MHTLLIICTTMVLEAALGLIILERYFVIRLKQPLRKKPLTWRQCDRIT